ncbi:MAG: hypothetical protein JWO03_488 [Bacteroidetes bacterium]|nr:hypothetical protein [Bacteroidota bacterium]
MERRNMNKLILALLLCGTMIANCQERYQWQSKLSGVNGEGFYRVLLRPDITSRSTHLYSDLRIVDSAGHYVPYLIKSEAPVSQSQDFQAFNFSTHADSLFRIDIENPTGRMCEELRLTLRNTDIGKGAEMTGSDDGKTWYDLTDIIIHPGRSLAADTFDQVISLPPVKYHHLRISIRMVHALPVNVLRIGAYEAFSTEGTYSTILQPTKTILDSAKTTYITLRYDAPYEFDKLLFHIDGPKLYHRSAHIYSRDTTGLLLLTECTLSSNAHNAINISAKTREFRIEIENQDNPPLQINTIGALQLNRYAIMYLDADRNYFLVFGNQKATLPTYDLHYFEDSLSIHKPKDLAAASIISNTIIPGTTPVTHAEAKGLKSYWLWPVLIVVLGILLFFTFRMGREIEEKR